MKKIVVLGGGYGGYKLVNSLLQKQVNREAEILLVDKTPYHTLKTEFYALAAGTIADKAVRMPFPEGDNLTFACDVVTHIDLEANEVQLGHSGTVRYDELVIGLGSEDGYRNIKGAREYAYSVQTIENARRTYEAVQNVPPYGQITIVGAGLTGVELASEIRESRHDLRVRLLDKGATILPSMPDKLQVFITDWLRTNNIDVIHHSNVEYIENGAVCNEGECLLTDVTIWAGGIQPNMLLRDLPVDKDHYGRIKLNEFHQVPTHPHVYVLGDCAALPHPPSAQVAKVQGKQIADILADVLAEKPLKTPEGMKIKGALGSLGKYQGFGTAYGKPVSGPVARLMKSGILWMHKFNK